MFFVNQLNSFSKRRIVQGFFLLGKYAWLADGVKI